MDNLFVENDKIDANASEDIYLTFDQEFVEVGGEVEKDYNALTNKPKLNGIELVGDVAKPTYTAQEVGALPVNTPIPTESTVAGWGFTKNKGNYTKPESGIPASDLSQDVQDSIAKVYTTEERVVGNYKGEKLYQKTIEKTIYWNGQNNYNVDHGISNFKNVIKLDTTIGNYLLPYMGTGTFAVEVNANSIVYRNDSSSNWSAGYLLKATILYTKD